MPTPEKQRPYSLFHVCSAWAYAGEDDLSSGYAPEAVLAVWLIRANSTSLGHPSSCSELVVCHRLSATLTTADHGVEHRVKTALTDH